MNNKWIVEVKIAGKWVAVRPTGGMRYEYATRIEAMQMMNMCYSDSIYGEDVLVRQLRDGE